MLKWLQTAGIIALAICFAAAFGAQVWQASHAPQPPSQHAATKNDYKADNAAQKERPEEAIARYNWWLTGFTAILAFATAGLGTLNFFQLRLARAEYISSYRPRIVLRDAVLIGDTIHYTLVNLGGTPATIIESRIFAEMVEEGTRLRPLWPASHFDLAKLGFIGGESIDLQYPLPNEVGFAIRHPEVMRIGIENRPGFFGKTYFVGALIYEDDLGMKRRSIFRRCWDPASLTFVRLTPEQERDHEYAD
jgi:hypothetical protein